MLSCAVLISSKKPGLRRRSLSPRPSSAYNTVVTPALGRHGYQPGTSEDPCCLAFHVELWQGLPALVCLSPEAGVEPVL